MLPIGAVVTAIFGVAIGAPTLRLRGDYLAIVTLGFGEIVPITLLNADKFTAGTIGIGGIDKPSIPGIYTFDLTNPWPFYVLVLAMLAVVVIVVYRLEDSKIGRAWEAIREDELAAESSGINTRSAALPIFKSRSSTMIALAFSSADARLSCAWIAFSIWLTSRTRVAGT